MNNQNPEKDWRKEPEEITEEEKQFYFPILAVGTCLVLGFLFGLVFFSTISARESYFVNLYTSLISVVVTVGIVEAFSERRSRRQLKEQLIREMGSSDHGVASRAVKELRVHKWIQDGSLCKANFTRANLKGVDLSYADLRGANFSEANLEAAILDYAKLQRTTLSHTICEDASFRWAKLQNAWVFDINLRRADVVASNFSGVELYHAHLEGAKLEERILVILNDGSEAERILAAKFSTETILPDYTRWAEGRDLTQFTNSTHPAYKDNYDTGKVELQMTSIVSETKFIQMLKER